MTRNIETGSPVVEQSRLFEQAGVTPIAGLVADEINTRFVKTDGQGHSVFEDVLDIHRVDDVITPSERTHVATASRRFTPSHTAVVNEIAPNGGVGIFSKLRNRVAAVGTSLTVAGGLTGALLASPASAEPQKPSVTELKKFFQKTQKGRDECVDNARESGIAEVHVDDETGEELVVPELGVWKEDRVWADGISNPYEADKDDPEALRTEQKATLCESASDAGQFAWGLAHTNIDGIPLYKAMPWLEKWNVPEDQLNDLIAELSPTRNYDADYEPTDAELEAAWEAYVEHQLLAERLGALLDRGFKMIGVRKGKTILNMHITLPSDDIPEIGPNDEQAPDAEALMFAFTKKIGGKCTQLTFGFNTGDKRFEVFQECAPGTTSKPPETPPSSVPNKVLYPTPGGLTPGVTLPPVEGAPVPDNSEHPVGGTQPPTPTTQSTLPPQEGGGDTGEGTGGDSGTPTG
ncbi:MAG: hypothetical protein A3F54_04035 [Candidatus Kerfeldbacteria bacterium RIFCSPHIGHO2_12_FULL_48_17]|uniref:Uncharacterized protein n=1 Tax=Candidatus Kerfeldbacteria bacterium RIFCSPHIGHO2_12_FULL_48_17 TaxID=1798542 RepID=A0A1G2B2B6_9BACT|nr:MAG: hypothetical protein A3F54_04035 [Candidatus Kerfeldbacteria bacterium RIFCSPHIGHO2_12_FULL_48_17]